MLYTHHLKIYLIIHATHNAKEFSQERKEKYAGLSEFTAKKKTKNKALLCWRVWCRYFFFFWYIPKICDSIPIMTQEIFLMFKSQMEW